MSLPDPNELFEAYYYSHSCGEPYGRTEFFLRLFDNLAERIVTNIGPKTVLDAGCAMGMLVEYLRKRGVDAWGVDISEYAIQNVHPDIKPYCWVGSITEPFPRRYDLIVSIEVLEHMAQPDAEKAAVNICQHTDDILFSSTPNDYKEATHFNVQSPEVWAELFARQGFYRDVDFDASFITPWAARYRRNREPVHRLVRDYERKFWLLWKENSDLRRLILENRDQLAAYDQQFHALEAETARLNQVIQDLITQIGQRDQKIQDLSFEKQVLTAQLADIHEGDVWKIALRLRALRLRLAPVGSRRERALQQIQRLFRV